MPRGKTREVIDRLRAYRSRLLKAGRLLEARAVARCIEIAREVVKLPLGPGTCQQITGKTGNSSNKQDQA